MATCNEDEDKKRKRTSQSSISEGDTSISESVNQTGKKNKKKKKKEDDLLEEEENILESQSIKMSSINKLSKQINDISLKLEKIVTQMDTSMKNINEKMSNVIMKDDETIKTTIASLMKKISDDILKPVFDQVEKLESKLFDTDKENDNLKAELQKMKQQNEKQQDEHDKITQQIEKNERDRKRFENETEQYSRRNNIRIAGLEDTDDRETAETTTKHVLKLLTEKMKLGINKSDIDIAHRLPKKKNGKRDVIVRFCSRMTRDEVMRNKKTLKNTGYYINEDLTYLNQHVLMCVKRKMKDEVDQAWSFNGKIFKRNKMGHISEVKFDMYQQWIDLPWPSHD